VGAAGAMTGPWTAAPDALTGRRRVVLWSAAAFVALTRLFAISKSMWEWDEALFALAVHDYDLTLHRPHPPGFPLFIGAAKLVRLFIGSDFRALQTVTVAASVALLPLLFFLARELRFAFSTSLLGASLFAFFPNVWYFGGTGFSDVPAFALAIASSMFFLRGVRSNGAFIAAAVLLGMTLSIRPQNLLLVLVPAAIGTIAVFRRSRSVLAIALAAGLSIIALSYGGAALASQSPREFVRIVRAQQQYVRTIDSVFNPRRPPLEDLFQDFIREPMRAGDRATALAVLAVAGIIAIAAGANRSGGAVFLAMFVPMALFSWTMLDFAAVTRYAVSYVAGHALLAAHGVWWLARPFKRFAVPLQTMVIAGLAAAYALWALPGIQEVRANDAPTAAAMNEVLRSVPPSVPLYVKSGLLPFAQYFLETRGRLPAYIDSESDAPADPSAWIVMDSEVPARAGKVFARSDGRTFHFGRRRYFVTSVVPIGAITRFGSGWYEEEPLGDRGMRWMAGRGEVQLPPSEGRMRLMVDIRIPTPLIARGPQVSVTLNGRLVERFRCRGEFARREWLVTGFDDRANALVIATDQVVNPARAGLGNDGRDLGLQLRAYAWRPAR
jgi:hypothetical protein